MKYKLRTDLSINFLGKTLYRIEALVSFGDVNKGEKGGYVESERNLSQVSGNAWVYGDAQVSGNAQVYGNARVSGNAWVYGDAQVYDDAQVYGNARVSGNARVYDDARVYGNAQVYGNARVSGNAWVSKSHHLINITNFSFNITILPFQVQVGCKLIEINEIDNVTYESVKNEGICEMEFETMKFMINEALEYIHAKIAEEE